MVPLLSQPTRCRVRNARGSSLFGLFGGILVERSFELGQTFLQITSADRLRWLAFKAAFACASPLRFLWISTAATLRVVFAGAGFALFRAWVANILLTYAFQGFDARADGPAAFAAWVVTLSVHVRGIVVRFSLASVSRACFHPCFSKMSHLLRPSSLVY